MKRYAYISVLFLGGFLAACSSSDDDLTAISVIDPPSVTNARIEVQRVTFPTPCTSFPVDGWKMEVTVIEFSADVNWLGNSTCLNGPDEGNPCINNIECTDFGFCGGCDGGTDDGQPCDTDLDCPNLCVAEVCDGGADDGQSCSISADCAPNSCVIQCIGGDTAGAACSTDDDCAVEPIPCGDPADRLVFASTITDPVTSTETGVVLFDDGSLSLNLPGTLIPVISGDPVADDLRYTRRFAIVNNIFGVPMESCIPEVLQITAIKVDKGTFFASGDFKLLDFRIDVVDTATGSAKLTIVTSEDVSGSPVLVEILRCCKPLDPGDPGSILIDCETGGTCGF